MKKLLIFGLMALGLESSAQITVDEGFEATAFPPTGWSTPSSSSFSRVTATGYFCGGTAAARRNIYGSGTYQTSYMMYESSNSNGNAIDVSFKYITKGYYNTSGVDGNMVVEYSANGGTTWATIGQSITLNSELNCSTFTGTIPAGAVPAGTNFRFRVTGNNNSTNTSADWYLSLDDVKLTQVAACYVPTNLLATANTTNSVTLAWTPPAIVPSNGYEIYYSTTNTAPTASTVPQVTNVTGATANITGLQPDTVYYFWVRGKCAGSDVSSWTSAASRYTGYCLPANTGTYYVKSFVTTGATSNINYSATSFVPWVNNATTSYLDVIPLGTFDYTITPSSGSNYFYIWVDWNNDLDFDDAGETIVATTSYASNNSGNYTIPASVAPGNYRMRVANSFSGTASACGPSGYGNHVDFTIRVATPTCWSPTAATVTNVMSTSAIINWTAPAIVPANGYDVYYSTTNTAPTPTTVPQLTNVTGTSVTVNGLTPSSNYYAWIRGNCGGSDTSVWLVVPIFRTTCQPPSLSLTGATVCMNGAATLTGSTDAGSTIKWYADATSTTPLATGNSYVTQPLTSTTTYYASSSNKIVSTLGKTSLNSDANGTGGGVTSYLQFNASTDFTLKTVDIYPYSPTAGTTGSITIALKDLSGNVLMTKTVNTVGQNTVANSVAQTVNLDFPIVAGQSYRLGVQSWTGTTNMFRDSSGLNYPYTLANVAQITGTDLATSYYYFFYNWQIETGCESPRQLVTATVDTNCLSTSEVSAKNDIKVYPNPFVDVVNISNADEVKSIAVVDAAGRLVKTIEKVSSQISLGDLKSGMYILNLNKKDGSKESIKMIKK